MVSGSPFPLLAPPSASAILEREWDRQLFATGRKPGLATQLGWHSHWTFNSKGSAHGFPDRTLARERVIFAELKRDLTGRASEDRNRQPSPQQRAWLDALAVAGAECYLWRSGDLEEVARILSRRWRFVPAGASCELAGATLEGPRLVDERVSFAPRCAWIPGEGRRDG
jgi:hypothetical protein